MNGGDNGFLSFEKDLDDIFEEGDGKERLG